MPLGSPGAVAIAVRRQRNRETAAAMPNLHTYDPERQPRDLHFNIDEGIQALAVDDARICNRNRNAFGFGVAA